MKYKKYLFMFLFLFIGFFSFNNVYADVSSDFLKSLDKGIIATYDFGTNRTITLNVNGSDAKYYHMTNVDLLNKMDFAYNSSTGIIIFYYNYYDTLLFHHFDNYYSSQSDKTLDGDYFSFYVYHNDYFGVIHPDNVLGNYYLSDGNSVYVSSSVANHHYSVLNFPIDNLDDWHFTQDLYDNLDSLVKKADLEKNSLGSVVTSKENLDYNSIIDIFNERLQSTTNYDYDSFVFHTIYEDVNTSDLSNGIYHIAFYDDSIDFEFADVPEKNDSKAHSVGSYNYFLNKSNKYGSVVCRTSFNSLDDLQNISKIKCSSVDYIESKGDYYNILWANNPISLFYKNWLGFWTYKDYFNKVSNYESFSDKLELAPNEVVLFKPINHTSSFTTKYAVNNVYESGWLSYNDNSYSFLDNTISTLKEYTYVNDILNYKSIYSVDVYSSYITNGYYYSISNRNDTSNLSVWYNSSDFQPFIFRTDTSSLTDGDIVLNSPNSYVRDLMNNTFGTFKESDYESLTKQEVSDKGLNNSSNSSTGVIDSFFDITKTIDTAKNFYSAFIVIGTMGSTFLETMPPLFANGLYALFGLGLIILLIKLFL